MIGFTIGHEDPVSCKTGIDYSRMPKDWSDVPAVRIDPGAIK